MIFSDLAEDPILGVGAGVAIGNGEVQRPFLGLKLVIWVLLGMEVFRSSELT